MKQNLFRSSYVEFLKNQAKNKKLEAYFRDEFDVDQDEVLFNPEIEVEYPKLILPDGTNNFDFENSKLIFEAYKNLTPTQATDARIWTYLAHTVYLEYMKKRYPIRSVESDKQPDFILTHWFLENISAQNLLRNGISVLWWVAYLTYDEARKDPYELTKEAFSMLDYTRHLLPGIQGRNKSLRISILEFVVRNKDLFAKYKESKVRFLMRKTNNLAGHIVFGSLSKEQIEKILDSYVGELVKEGPR